MINGLKPYPAYKDSGVPHANRRSRLPRQAGAWYNPASVKVGYEISFNRYFYKPRAGSANFFVLLETTGKLVNERSP